MRPHERKIRRGLSESATRDLMLRRTMLLRRPHARSHGSLLAPHGSAPPPDGDRRRHDRRRLRVVTPSEPEANPAETASRLRVLVVDDERSIRALCRVNLQLAGLDVLEAENGEEALQQVEQESPDIVLLDVMMPRLDGWQVAQRLADGDGTRDLPIIFLSARAGQEDRRQGFDAGGVGYVVKPFDPLTLAETLRRTVDRLHRGERDELRQEMLEP
jgi:CheY-like chemotaxis protein